MRLLLALLLCSAVCHASEFERLVSQLNDESFDVREAATRRLGQLDTKYAIALWKLRSHVRPEVAERIYVAVKQIVQTTMMHRDPYWLHLRGTVGISYARFYKPQTSIPNPGNKWNYSFCLPDAYKVFCVKGDCPAAGKLEENDLIVKINGYSAAEMERSRYSNEGWIVPGHTYVLDVERPIDGTPACLTVRVTVVSRMKEEWEFEPWEEEAIRCRIWDQFQNRVHGRWNEWRYVFWARRLGVAKE